MKHLWIGFLVLSIFGTAKADDGLDQFKKSFAAKMPEYLLHLDEAKTLKAVEIPLGGNLTRGECITIVDKARSAVKIDPFQFHFANGYSVSKMCGGEYGVSPNHLLQQKGQTQFGIPYDFIVQLKLSRPSESKKSYANYFFSAAYEIVQTELLDYDPNGRLQEFFLKTKNLAGDVYHNHFKNRLNLPQKNIEGSASIQGWIPADGSTASIILRNRVVSVTNPKHFYESMILSRTDRKDWDDFALPLTHVQLNGYFGYAGKYYSHPKYESILFLHSSDAKPPCAWGSQSADGQDQVFPAIQAERAICINY